MTQILLTLAVAGALVALIEAVVGLIRPTARGVPAMAAGLVLLAAAAGLVIVDGSPELRELLAPLLGQPRATVWKTVGSLGLAVFVGAVVASRLRVPAPQRANRREETNPEELRELTTTRELLQRLVRSSISGVMILQAVRSAHRRVLDFECRLLNQEAERMLGRSAKALLGQRLLPHLPCLEKNGLFQEAVSVVETKLPFRDERRIRQDDRDHWYQIAIVSHGDGVVVSFNDVSDRKKSEEQLRHAAEHDALTSLPSRVLLMDRLQQAINRAKRVPGYKFAVLFLDFDRFKIINDSLGHEVGDQLLISISERLRANLRDIDTSTRLGQGKTPAGGAGEHLPARLGGDEFVILLDGISSPRDVIIVAERLQEALSEPHMLDGHEVISTASIGIVTSDGNYDNPDEILRDADTAMYQAKNSGKARHIVFDEGMHSEVMQRLHLEKELRAAADALDFKLMYQPIVELDSGRLSGFEALLRWPHPQRGLVQPADFIPLAEEIGLIVPIGRWAIGEAVRQLAEWRKRPDAQDLTMSVNLSRLQLLHPQLVDDVRDILNNNGLDPASLILEVTESTIMADARDLAPILDQLRREGVRLAMDDFGTGHSSLSFLHQVPMNMLKIDRSFVDSAESARGYGAIINAVVQLAHNLELDVVAEGIETAEQLAMLQALDCNYGQGWLFSPPVDAEAAEVMLSRDNTFGAAADGTAA